MRPVHEILELARPYLRSASNPTGWGNICGAIDAANTDDILSDHEADAACQVVMGAVHQLSGSAIGVGIFLRDAAVLAGLLPANTKKSAPEYIRFRDEWLQRLIDEQRTKADSAHKAQ